MSSGFPEPKVAIVVTCFDSGRTLNETIASILSCGTQVELVVVDDGSADPHTLDVLHELEQRNIRVLRQENRGQSAATMRGVDATTAQFVMRFDSDDLLERGALDDLADALEATPEADVAWGDFQTFGRTTFVVPGAPALDPWLVTLVNLVPGSGALLRRDVLKAAGGWRLADGFEDWDLWMTLAEQGRAGIYVPRIVFHYRRNRDVGRQEQARRATERHYASLLSKHTALVHDRRRNLRASPAPRSVKLLVQLIELLPFVPRLLKINTCEFLARLLWSRRTGDAVEMLRQRLLGPSRDRAQ